MHFVYCSPAVCLGSAAVYGDNTAIYGRSADAGPFGEQSFERKVDRIEFQRRRAEQVLTYSAKSIAICRLPSTDCSGSAFDFAVSASRFGLARSLTCVSGPQVERNEAFKAEKKERDKQVDPGP